MDPSFLLIRQALILIATGTAAYTDAKTGLIPDKITYPMIALGIILNVIQGEWLFTGAGALVFAAGYIIYYMGKIGGGDVKLFTGITLLLPILNGQIFLLNTLFAASMLAVTFYSTYYVSKYARTGINWKENKQSIRKAMLFAAMIAAYFTAAITTKSMPMQTAIAMTIPLTLALTFLALEKGIRHQFFLKQISIEKLEEDEVIATEFLDKNIKEKLGLKIKGVLGEKEIQKMKQTGLKKVPVYRGMPPFGPFIFLGCIAAIAQPNIIGLLLA